MAIAAVTTLVLAAVVDERAKVLAVSRQLLEQQRVGGDRVAKANRTLEAVISASPAAIMLLDADGTVRLWNRASQEIFGWNAEEVVGRFLPVITDEQKEEFKRHLAHVASGERLIGVQTTRRRRDGAAIDVQLFAAPILHADGHRQCLWVVVDVSEQVRERRGIDFIARASAALASSLDYRQTIDQITQLLVPEFGDWCLVDLLADDGFTDRIAVAHADPTKADVAAAMPRRLPPITPLHQGAARAIAGEPQLAREVTPDLVRRIARNDAHLAALERLEMRSYVCAPMLVGGRACGAITLISCSRSYGDKDLALVVELAHRAAVAIDHARLFAGKAAAVLQLTNLQELTSALSQAHEAVAVAQAAVRLGREAVGAASAVLWVVTDGGALELLASSGVPEEFVAEWRAIPAGSDLPAIRVLNSREAQWVENAEEYRRLSPTVAARAEEADRLYALGIVPLVVARRSIGVIAFSHRGEHVFQKDERAFILNVADQCAQALERARLFEAAQRDRLDAESASRAKDEFLAMLGHELRNPLAPITTAVQLMRLRGGPQIERERAVIERQTNHLVRLVDDLLDVSRITRGKIQLRRQPIDLADFVAEAIEAVGSLIEQRHHRLEVSLPPMRIRIDGDAHRLRQVVGNLLTNAAKYTPSGGRIVVAGQVDQDRATLIVRDTGVGIAPELLPRIFDLFVQGTRSIDRSEGGLGLGLALVRSLVELHGGSVSATSEGEGRGAEFRVTLPMVVTPVLAPVAPPPLPERPGAPARVLIVDDNADAAEMLAALLDGWGFETAVAYDGPRALTLAPEFRPQIGLLDIGLPIMDGYELAAKLRALPELASVRLFALTGYGQSTDRERALLAGFDEHLAKPVSPERLRAALEPVVSSGAQS